MKYIQNRVQLNTLSLRCIDIRWLSLTQFYVQLTIISDYHQGHINTDNLISRIFMSNHRTKFDKITTKTLL